MPSEQLAQIVQMLRANQNEAKPSVEQTRQSLEGMAVAFADAGSQFRAMHGLRAEAVDIAGIPAEWISPSEISVGAPVLLYLHGGGYVAGSIRTHRDLASRLALAAQGRALLVEYRLAPEHRFPAALEDAVKAYRWLNSGIVDPKRLVIAGDSAGGGLTLATLVALRDAGDSLPAAAVCLSPWTDLAGSGESLVTKKDVDPFVSADGLEIFVREILGDADPRTPLASPLYADLKGLPPLLIQVGTAEVLLDDATRFAARAKAAGVDVTLEIWEDMIHVWQAFATILPEGQQAIDRIGQFVRQHTG